MHQGPGHGHLVQDLTPAGHGCRAPVATHEHGRVAGRSVASVAHDEQTVLWNEVVGEAWVRHADRFDATLEPFGAATFERLDLQSGERVVDIGCGAGRTTLDAAARVHPGEVVGLDVSAPLLAEARRRAHGLVVGNVRFVEADLGSPDAAASLASSESFDVAFSRFGVMFFADPLAAFSNLARTMVPNGRLGFVCFQGPERNPFITVPVLTAAAHLAMAPLPGPDEPSPFSLADPARIRSLLGAAGFGQISIDAGPDRATLGNDQDLQAMAARLLEQNPSTAPALMAADAERRSAAVQAVAEALAGHVTDGEVRLGAGSWIVQARLTGDAG